MGSTLTTLLFHVIFSTKSRTPMINSEMRDELYSYMGGIIKRHGGVLLKAGGIDDHVHLIIKLKPVYALSEIIQKIKGSSSKWINEKQYLTDRFSWQE